MPCLQKKAAAHSTDKKAWFDNLELRLFLFSDVCWAISSTYLWAEQHPRIWNFPPNKTYIADANRQIFVLSIAAKFCIFAFLLEYLLWIIELQIFARIVLFVSCYGAVGTFAVVVNFFTIYKLQQANAGMNVVVVHSSEIRGLCLMKWPTEVYKNLPYI